MMLTSEELEAIRGRVEAASPPPWPNSLPGLRQEDNDFIAHARTDVPALLDMVEEFEVGKIINRKAIAELQRQADRIAELEDINGGLRKWQDLTRPKLEARIAHLEATSVSDLTSMSEPAKKLRADIEEYAKAAQSVGWLPPPDQSEDKS